MTRDVSHIAPGDELGLRRDVNDFIKGNLEKYRTTYRPDVARDAGDAAEDAI
jgi:hypothetical protein